LFSFEEVVKSQARYRLDLLIPALFRVLKMPSNLERRSLTFFWLEGIWSRY